jgi:CHAT domain-containing protein/pimeloyl-ACP methyl ester carboxylesterase
MKIEEVERRLAEGDVDAEMELYFGPQLPELMTLAKSAQVSTRSTRGKRPKVLVLPGIMGSTLGFKRPILSMFHDTVWLDPLDVTMGRLNLLAVPSAKKIIALDPFPLVYLGMKLHLKQAGFDAEYFPYDWRLNLQLLGGMLKAKLDSMKPDKVHLAAHSMGGLVARAALKQGASNIGTVVMMGTPNHGSYSPVLAFRGVHELASLISSLDLTQDGVKLTEEVFSTFEGLAQMLPLAPIANGRDWHDPGQWPDSPKLRKEVLKEAAKVSSLLANPRKDWHLIAGINQETIVRAERDPSGTGLRYQCNFLGDGTVPVDSARMPSLENRVYYVDHGHGTLTMNDGVKRAVVQLFRGEEVAGLRRSLPEVRPSVPGWIGEADLKNKRRAVSRSVSTLITVGDAAERLHRLLDHPLGEVGTVNPGIPAGRPGEAPLPTAAPLLQGYTVSRETQHYLEIELVHGDISQVNAEAIVLARFQNMDLGRAAQSVDARMDGVLTSMMERRMFSSQVGEIFVLPTGRRLIGTDIVAIAGLGARDKFIDASEAISWETLELVAENTLRTLLGAGVTEFATLLFGNLADAGPEVMREGIRRFLSGFIRGLKDSKDSRRFRRVLLCEADAVRYAQLRKAILDLLPDPLFETVQVRLDESVLPPPPHLGHRNLMAASAGEQGRDPTYIFVRTEDEGATIHFEMTILPVRKSAAIPREVQRVSRRELNSLLKRVNARNAVITAETVRRVGEELAAMLLHPRHQTLLETENSNPIIIVHDEEGSRIPWETLQFPTSSGETSMPACVPGVSRQYAASNLSVAKWVEARRDIEQLHVLLITNPTKDLDGAEREGARIRELFTNKRGVTFTEMAGDQATRSTLLEHFRSGKYDVVHFAGHAFFDPIAPQNSGIICAPKNDSNPSIISGADLAGLGQLPMLMFLNACESARVRGHETVESEGLDRLPAFASVAEAMMRGGIANFLGTYWPVEDDAALAFATSFYSSLLKHVPLGVAVTEARQTVKETGSGDWADYLHYGSPNFMLKSGFKI